MVDNTVQRSMMDNWASWRRRKKYAGGPKKPTCVIGDIQELGITTGPVHYSQHEVDPDEAAQFVDQFMIELNSTHHRIWAALMARHTKEYIDRTGAYRQGKGMPIRDIAMQMYGTSQETARKHLSRLCNEGYDLMRRHA